MSSSENPVLCVGIPDLWFYHIAERLSAKGVILQPVHSEEELVQSLSQGTFAHVIIDAMGDQGYELAQAVREKFQASPIVIYKYKPPCPDTSQDIRHFPLGHAVFGHPAFDSLFTS